MAFGYPPDLSNLDGEVDPELHSIFLTRNISISKINSQVAVGIWCLCQRKTLDRTHEICVLSELSLRLLEDLKSACLRVMIGI